MSVVCLPGLLAPEGRRELKGRGFKVSLSARDLGGQVIYCKQLRNKDLTDRIDNVLPCFKRLRAAQLPLKVKMLNVQQVV